MDVLFELLIKLMSLTVIMIFLIGLLFIMLISVVYIAGYVYDSIFGNLFISLGHFISGKYPKIKNISIVEKLWRKIQPKELYLRYETPLFTYCFSYTAISLLALVLPNENGTDIVWDTPYARHLYYHPEYNYQGAPMRGGYWADRYMQNGGQKQIEQYYEKILDNNIEFLKLSFLPLGFIITVLGFCFTITGMKVQELPLDFAIIENTYTSLMNYNDETNTLMLFLKLLVSGGLILILFYVISLPIQVISYFVISVINYFRKHKAGYIGLYKKFIGIVAYFLKNI